MITDDPGTPGNGHWENNIAVIFEHRPDETSWDSPLIDLNYGVGEHIQLTLQGGPALSQAQRAWIDRRPRWNGGGREMAFSRRREERL